MSHGHSLHIFKLNYFAWNTKERQKGYIAEEEGLHSWGGGVDKCSLCESEYCSLVHNKDYEKDNTKWKKKEYCIGSYDVFLTNSLTD